MDRIVAANSVPLSGADVAPATGTPEYATSGNPATPTPATVLPAYWVNMIQDEIRKVITDAGIAPDDSNWGQLSQAIQALIASGAATKLFIGGTSAGAANAQTVATQRGNFTNVAGNIVTWESGFTNTGATTLNPDGAGAITVKKRATSGLVDVAANDIVANEEYMAISDGSVLQLMSPASNAAAFLQAANNLSDLASLASALTNLGFINTASNIIQIPNPNNIAKPWLFQFASLGSSGSGTFTYPTTFPTAVKFVGVLGQQGSPCAGLSGAAGLGSANYTNAPSQPCYGFAVGN